MQRKYAIAELAWAREKEGGITGTLEGKVRIPAVFHDDTSGIWWTLVVLLPTAVHAGDEVIVRIAALMEQADVLLREGSRFDLKEGPRTVAVGRVVKVGTFQRQGDESVLEALKRTASVAPNG